jgi:MoaA/NifB/PqqE/SkfB family radical SAM enzyme
MYKLDEIKSIHLEITTKCQASCPMCARNINGGIKNPWLQNDEISLEKFKKWFTPEFISQLDRLYMCGNTGDPIMSEDTLEIFKYLRSVNPTIDLSMNTNGSARNSSWWKALAEIKVKVIFGIDGMSDTHSLYRIGTNFDKILLNAKQFIDAGGNAEWHMLVFKHNEHQIDMCKWLSESLKFKKFVSKNTSRFRNDQLNVIGDNGKTIHVIYPSSKSTNISTKIKTETSSCTINCKVSKDKSLYVSANGLISPCCWLDFNGSNPASTNLLDFTDNGFSHPNLNKNTLNEIFDGDFFIKIKETWNKTPLVQCTKQCGNVDKFNEQFE